MTKPTHGAPKQISIRLGNLAEPIQQAAAIANLSTGEWIKRALAERLGVEIEPYKPDPSSMAKMAAAKRWGKDGTEE